MPSRSPESVENGLETETTKNEIEQSIAVETETQKNTKCNCFNFKSFAKRGCRTLVRQPLTFTSHIVRSLDSHYHSSKLLTDFFIRNKSREAVLIISKISQMNQIRKNIVLTSVFAVSFRKAPVFILTEAPESISISAVFNPSQFRLMKGRVALQEAVSDQQL